MKRFEYKTILANTNDGTDSLDYELNNLGDEGWELVTAATDNSVDGDGDTYTEYIWYTLKRELD